jgi:hypothetical protein
MRIAHTRMLKRDEAFIRNPPGMEPANDINPLPCSR